MMWNTRSLERDVFRRADDALGKAETERPILSSGFLTRSLLGTPSRMLFDDACYFLEQLAVLVGMLGDLRLH